MTTTDLTKSIERRIVGLTPEGQVAVRLDGGEHDGEVYYCYLVVADDGSLRLKPAYGVTKEPRTT